MSPGICEFPGDMGRFFVPVSNPKVMMTVNNGFSVSDLLQLLQPKPVGAKSFLGASPNGGTPHVYGGQLVAQAIMAMGCTVHADHTLHSTQGYFLRAGDRSRAVNYEVESLRDGRRFSTRGVRAYQGEKLVYVASASFHAAEGDFERLQDMPSVLEPEQLESEAEYLARQNIPGDAKSNFSPFFIELFERRSADWRHPTAPGVREPRNGIWIRLREKIDAPSLLHQVLVAYISDMDLMNTPMRPRGIGYLDPSSHAASLDHVMWFHAPIRADSWFYYEIDGPSAIHNRGLGIGAIFQDGHRVVTAVQEGILRAGEFLPHR